MLISSVKNFILSGKIKAMSLTWEILFLVLSFGRGSRTASPLELTALR